MEFVIRKQTVTGGAIKHSVVICEDDKGLDGKSKMKLIIVRYNAIPVTIDLLLDKKLGFSETMKRINNIVELDDEMFNLISSSQKE